MLGSLFYLIFITLTIESRRGCLHITGTLSIYKFFKLTKTLAYLKKKQYLCRR